jgi:hypothetical protein
VDIDKETVFDKKTGFMVGIPGRFSHSIGILKSRLKFSATISHDGNEEQWQHREGERRKKGLGFDFGVKQGKSYIGMNDPVSPVYNSGR